MPYCPKCDMEFIDGITVCSDCGGSLVESEEAARALKEQERQEKLMAEMAGMEYREASADAGDLLDGSWSGEEKLPERPIAPARIYVNKAQKYEDLKSSASAFLIVGIALLAASVVCWTGIVKLPMSGVYKIIFQSAITIMGVLSLAVTVNSTRAANKLSPQIEEENKATKDLIQWFTDTYTGEDVDRAIPDCVDLPAEELSLKRFQIIQDYLITGHDLPDQAYVDTLSEDIYGKLYE